jgi:hypothetical protein
MAFENLLLGSKLSEFHTGYRAFSREVLTKLPLLANLDDFVFDNQILAQVVAFGFAIGEISCPTRYFPEASTTYGVPSYMVWQCYERASAIGCGVGVCCGPACSPSRQP